MTGVLLIPAPVEVFGDPPELNDQDARKIGRGGLTALFSPETVEGLFVLAHDDPGIRAADELAAVDNRNFGQWLSPCNDNRYL